MREGGAGRRVGRARSAPAPARRHGGRCECGGGSAAGRTRGRERTCARLGEGGWAEERVRAERTNGWRGAGRYRRARELRAPHPPLAGPRGGARGRGEVARSGPEGGGARGATRCVRGDGAGGVGGELGDAVAARGMNVGMLSLGRE